MCLYIFLKNLNWICLKKSESRVSDQVHSRGGFANIKYQVICCLSTHPRNLALYASSLIFLVKYTDIQKQLVHACALKKTVPVHFNAFKWSRKCFPQQFLKMKLRLKFLFNWVDHEKVTLVLSTIIREN